MEKSIRMTISKNLQTLCKLRKEKPASLADRIDPNQTTVNRLINYKEGAPDPKLETITQTAKALDVDAWVLFLDRVPEDLLVDKRFRQFVERLSKLNADSRSKIIEHGQTLIDMEVYESENNSK